MAPPDWAYPVNPPATAGPPADGAAIRVPQSPITFLPAQLANLFSAPDWHPDDHPPMPAVVAQGRPPSLYACGYCHLPDGAGRPENASLAGLPEAYIVQQVKDFRNGVRRSAVATRLPATLMTEVARAATDQEIAAAAGYYSHLQPQVRVRVIETETVPHTHVAGWTLAFDRRATLEPIGQRLIEVAGNFEQFEHRDARSRFVAYVPPGAVAAGERLVGGGGPHGIPACSGCHGVDLKGNGSVPGIAGRSPSYIVRQLVDIQTGSRKGLGAAPMTQVVQQLRIEDMMAISAYLATLN